jgi:hypothetical protein
LFIKQEIDTYAFPLLKSVWKRKLLVEGVGNDGAFNICFCGYRSKPGGNARISFNDQFFSLDSYSFIGFILLAALALLFFSCHRPCGSSGRISEVAA